MADWLQAEIELRFNSQRFNNWQQVSLRDSVDDLCASIVLGVSRPGFGDNLGLNANTLVQAYCNGELVSTIRVDTIRRRVDSQNHALQLSGRSLGRELVDCQYSKTFSGLKLAEVVKRLCATFQVPVTIDADTAVVPSFAMQCEVPANALINAARAANLLIYALPDGGLILTNPTTAAAVATLEYGKHFKRYEVIEDHKLRFSDYVVKSFDYSNDAAIKGGIKDTGIDFFRPMHIIADRYSQSVGGCGRRAELERNRRMARAYSIVLEVPGWGHENGLWKINTQVRVIIEPEGIDEVFLIGDRGLNLVPDDNGQGATTNLTVMRRSAWLGQPEQKRKRSAGTRGQR